MRIPDYVGAMAFGLKMGVILPKTDIAEKIIQALTGCHRDGFLENNDVVCITESVVARAQDNYINVDDIAREIKIRLGLSNDDSLAVVFPIASRNRFSLILKGMARAVSRGKVMVQFSFPADEVGNPVVDREIAGRLKKDLITMKDLEGYEFRHPVTRVDYIKLYREIIEEEGAEPVILLSNDPCACLQYRPDGIVAADIHTRAATRQSIMDRFVNCITLDEVFTRGEVYSEWGLLGSNMSSGERLKLAPREGKTLVDKIQADVKSEFGLDVQVMIFGDGAYLDPTTGIYELADPRASLAATSGLDLCREGIKYKYLADKCYHEQQKTAEEIEKIIADSSGLGLSDNCIEREGTTPRKMEDVLASLADLVSGSADAGTPVVIIKNFLS